MWPLCTLRPAAAAQHPQTTHTTSTPQTASKSAPSLRRCTLPCTLVRSRRLTAEISTAHTPIMPPGFRTRQCPFAQDTLRRYRPSQRSQGISTCATMPPPIPIRSMQPAARRLNTASLLPVETLLHLTPGTHDPLWAYPTYPTAAQTLTCLRGPWSSRRERPPCNSVQPQTGRARSYQQAQRTAGKMAPTAVPAISPHDESPAWLSQHG